MTKHTLWEQPRIDEPRAWPALPATEPVEPNIVLTLPDGGSITAYDALTFNLVVPGDEIESRGYPVHFLLGGAADRASGTEAPFLVWQSQEHGNNGNIYARLHKDGSDYSYKVWQHNSRVGPSILRSIDGIKTAGKRLDEMDARIGLLEHLSFQYRDALSYQYERDLNYDVSAATDEGEHNAVLISTPTALLRGVRNAGGVYEYSQVQTQAIPSLGLAYLPNGNIVSVAQSGAHAFVYLGTRSQADTFFFFDNFSVHNREINGIAYEAGADSLLVADATGIWRVEGLDPQEQADWDDLPSILPSSRLRLVHTASNIVGMAPGPEGSILYLDGSRHEVFRGAPLDDGTYEFELFSDFENPDGIDYQAMAWRPNGDFLFYGDSDLTELLYSYRRSVWDAIGARSSDDDSLHSDITSLQTEVNELRALIGTHHNGVVSVPAATYPGSYTATLSDPDGSVSAITYEWFRTEGLSSDWSEYDPANIGTAQTQAISLVDVGYANFYRCRVEYNDAVNTDPSDKAVAHSAVLGRVQAASHVRRFVFAAADPTAVAAAFFDTEANFGAFAWNLASGAAIPAWSANEDRYPCIAQPHDAAEDVALGITGLSLFAHADLSGTEVAFTTGWNRIQNAFTKDGVAYDIYYPGTSAPPKNTVSGHYVSITPHRAIPSPTAPGADVLPPSS